MQPTSTLSVEVEHRKHELDGKEAAIAPKKKSRRVDLPVPNAIHMKLRVATDAGRKWERDLEEIHGLSDDEACMVVGLVLKHLPKDEFANFDPKTERFLALAKPGWHLLKTSNEVVAKHPKENGEQIFRQGVWRMLNPISW
jgi:hypothetical protein